jgi:formylglycine-generating enzyme required for sulfatase activity
VAVYKDLWNAPHPVGTLQPNELGIYDMSGNVKEWCNDRYAPYKSNAQTNPTGPKTGSHRVLRGGSCQTDAWNCRVSHRHSDGSRWGWSEYGFRLAHSSSSKK